MGITARMFKMGLGDEDGIEVRPATEMTGKTIATLTQQASQTFLRRFGNLLSCFQAEGEDGLWATIHAAVQTYGLDAAGGEAIEDGDDRLQLHIGLYRHGLC